MNFYEYPITSNYGTRTDPFTKQTKSHNGVDYGLPYNTDVKANISGIVSKVAYDKSGYGNYVVVKDSTGRLHTYAHLTKASVNVGESINVNDVLGSSGSTGRSTDPHLHYEVKNSSGTNLNPNNFTSGKTYDDIQKDIFNDYFYSSESGLNYEDATSWKDKGKNIIFNIFKFIIIALLIVLCVVFLTKSMDIEIL